MFRNRALSLFKRSGFLSTTPFLRATTSLFTSKKTLSSQAVDEEIEKILNVIKSKGLEGKITLRGLAQLRKENPEVEKSMSAVGDLAAQYISQHPERAGYLPPVRVAVTGAAGSIGYSLLFRIASGEMLGPHQPVILQCLELAPALKALEGVAMELSDCAFPLLHGVVTTSDERQAFEGADFALLVGAKPRTKGMERADLLKENANIFTSQGKALNAVSNREELRVLVVGNPANTNALIASCAAPDIDPKQFTAMTRLDHNRGLAQLAQKTGCKTTEIERFCIWGNHSSTQYPDLSHTQVKGKWAKELVDEKWIKESFIPKVQQRGAAIIAARGSSSAASAANAAIEHMRDWVHGTNGQWTSMGVWTGLNGGDYGTAKDIYYSYPVVCEGGRYTIVQNVPVDKFSAERMQITNDELVAEKKDVGELAQRKK